MKDNFVEVLQQLFDRSSTPMKLPLLVYFACLPLFFSASAMSWPFPDSTDSVPSASRDCVIVTDAHETSQDPVEEEEEEPDCD